MPRGATLALSLPRYETDQLISIIGCKRPIADRLRMILSSLAAKGGNTLFLDPFCGSGMVSRIARSLGMQVRASDLEPFSFITNYVYLTLSNEDLVSLFAEMGGLDAYVSMLNLEGLYAARSGIEPTRPFLSAHYAPASDDVVDGERQRLFFTAGNARFLDTVREEIESAWLERRISAQEKAIMLASILYEASRKANTSGTFTAYHKRFSTAQGAVRTRILEPCTLRAPVLPDAELPVGEMHTVEASEFVKGYTADICYLDPPATVHQYGSTYHLLNSLAIWDDFRPSDTRNEEGKLIDRAGIRDDWKKTHSPYCSLKHADAAFDHLLNTVDARHIVLSYPSNGIVSAERIHELLSIRHAPVTVVPLHKRNRGGPQGKGEKRQVEQIFITGKAASLALPIGRGLELLPLIERLDRLGGAVFKRALELDPYQFIGGVLLDGLPPAEKIMQLSKTQLERQVVFLESHVCSSNEEALSVLLVTCMNREALVDARGCARLEKRLFSILRQLVEPLESDEVRTLEYRLLALVDQFGSPQFQRRPLVKRLCTFLQLTYDGKREDRREP